VHHGQIAVRLAELLDREGHIWLGQPPGSVSGRVRVVGEDSTLIDLTVHGQEFTVVVAPADRAKNGV
jgi:hypothetical protein